MTKATSETTKLNFITDQGSTRAMVRWACRAERFDWSFDWPFDLPFCAVFRIVTGPSPAAALPAPVLPGLADGAALGAAEPFVAEPFSAEPFAGDPFKDRPERRNARAGDDGELAGGSGISHANAAGETA